MTHNMPANPAPQAQSGREIDKQAAFKIVADRLVEQLAAERALVQARHAAAQGEE